MTTLNAKRVADPTSSEFPGKAETGIGDSQPHRRSRHRARGNVRGLVQGPMLQQAALGSHGYDIHPQQFVRLVGCGEK
jgi:hypothetical protein